MSIKEIFDSVVNRFLLLFLYSDLHAVMGTLFIAEAARSLTLFFGKDAFVRSPYSIMSQIMPNEHIWGILWMIVAIAQIYVLYNGNYHSKISCSIIAASGLFWWATTYAIYFSLDTPSPIASCCIALSFAITWVWIRVGWVPAGSRRKYGDHF